jgi:hypothetical protein
MIKPIALTLILAVGCTFTLAAGAAKHAQQAKGDTSSTQAVRDWAAIDVNKDGYIEPDEMGQYLQAQWTKAKQVAQKK